MLFLLALCEEGGIPGTTLTDGEFRTLALVVAQHPGGLGARQAVIGERTDSTRDARGDDLRSLAKRGLIRNTHYYAYQKLPFSHIPLKHPCNMYQPRFEAFAALLPEAREARCKRRAAERDAQRVSGQVEPLRPKRMAKDKAPKLPALPTEPIDEQDATPTAQPERDIEARTPEMSQGPEAGVLLVDAATPESGDAEVSRVGIETLSSGTEIIGVPKPSSFPSLPSRESKPARRQSKKEKAVSRRSTERQKLITVMTLLVNTWALSGFAPADSMEMGVVTLLARYYEGSTIEALRAAIAGANHSDATVWLRRSARSAFRLVFAKGGAAVERFAHDGRKVLEPDDPVTLRIERILAGDVMASPAEESLTKRLTHPNDVIAHVPAHSEVTDANTSGGTLKDLSGEDWVGPEGPPTDAERLAIREEIDSSLRAADVKHWALGHLET